MLKRDKPSEYFIGAILRGYDAEVAAENDPTPADIWNRIVIECIHRGDFKTMFRWDTSKGESNRVRDIAECIERGFVPGLRLDERIVMQK